MNKLKIHIVEDEIIIAYDLQDMLEDLGYVVNHISMSVDEVNDQLETDDSDLFILDINLRGEKSGFELGNKLAEMGKPIIYVSSNTDREAIEKAKKHIFLEKPYNIQDIDLAISSLAVRKKDRKKDKE